MHKVFQFLQKVVQVPTLRKKLLFTAGIFLAFRFLAHIPVPSVNTLRLGEIFSDNQFLSLLNVFSGGTLANLSVVAVGINPYITASIIMQLAGLVFPKIKEIQKDGEAGRERINQYTRLLTVPLAIVQSVSVIALLRSQELLTAQDPLSLIAIMTSLVAGAMIVMWLGELISLYGIGNGISMILFGGIISQLPSLIGQLSFTISSENSLMMMSFGVAFLLVIALIVYMNESVRKVSIQYAKRVRGNKVYGGHSTHLPIKVNVTGVLPIIFAVSLMLLPSFVAQLLVNSGRLELIEWGQRLTVWSDPTSVPYMVAYFVIVFFFTYFSALVFFNTEDIANELKKSGAFIPGIRPGSATKSFLVFVVTRITLVGALFLGSIAVLPSIAQVMTGIPSLAIGGTSVLIVVSVILETAKQAEGMMIEQNYDTFL